MNLPLPKTPPEEIGPKFVELFLQNNPLTGDVEIAFEMEDVLAIEPGGGSENGLDKTSFNFKTEGANKELGNAYLNWGLSGMKVDGAHLDHCR